MPKKSKALIPAPAAAVTAYTEAALAYVRAARPHNTERAYRAAWREFSTWAAEQGAAPLPAAPELVAAYLAALADAGAKVSTLQVKRAAIAAAHRAAGQPDPTTAERVRLAMKGITHEKRTAPSKKAPITADTLRELVAVLDRATLPGKRDAALLLVGFAGAFRRSELVALDVGDLRFSRGELRITVRKSKTDQEGRGLVKVIPRLEDAALCPVQALRAWLDAADIHSGPVWRRFRWSVIGGRLEAGTVAYVIKRAAEAAGLDPRQFAGHSLRSGFITSAAVAGVESRDIMAQSGHKSETVMRGYVQDAGVGAKRATRGAFGEKDDLDT